MWWLWCSLALAKPGVMVMEETVIDDAEVHAPEIKVFVAREDLSARSDLRLKTGPTVDSIVDTVRQQPFVEAPSAPKPKSPQVDTDESEEN